MVYRRYEPGQCPQYLTDCQLQLLPDILQIASDNEIWKSMRRKGSHFDKADIWNKILFLIILISQYCDLFTIFHLKKIF